jgi:hypothetical protein
MGGDTVMQVLTAGRAFVGRWALIPGLAFLAGLVLPIWAVSGKPPRGLPGLGSFPSAYLGDTVLVPAAVLLLAAAIPKLKAAAAERKLIASAAVLTALIAALAQAGWLHDRAPRLNWTLPRPGHFTAAGWWHAVYFAGMSAVFCGLLVLFLIRVRTTRRDPGYSVPTGPWTAVFIATTGTYVALAIHDSSRGTVGWASGSSLSLIGVSLVASIALAGWAYGRSARLLIRPALTGTGGAAAVTALVLGPAGPGTAGTPRLKIAETAAVALLTLAILIDYDLILTTPGQVPAERARRAIGAVTVSAVCASAWTVLSAAAGDHDLARVLVTGGVSALLLFGVMLGALGGAALQGAWFTALGIFTIGVAATASWFEAGPPRVAAGGPFLAIGIGLLMSFATSALQARTDYELGVPDEVSQHTERLRDVRIPRAHIVLGLIALFGLAAFLATLAFTVATNRGLPFPAPHPFNRADLRLLAVGAVALALAAATFAAGSPSTPRLAVRMLTWMASVVVPAAMSAFLLLSVSGALGKAGPPGISIAAVAGMVAFLWTANSVADNVWLLQGRRFRATDAFPTGSLALLSGSTVAWVLTQGVRTEHGYRDLWRAVAAAVIAVLLAILVGTLLGGAASRHLPRFTELPAWRGLLQDGFSIYAIVLIIAFPVVYLTTIIGLGKGLTLALPLIGFFSYPFYWVMKANRQWPSIEANRLLTPDEVTQVFADMGGWSWQRFLLDLKTQRRRLADPCVGPRTPEFIKVLAAHTRNQNRLAAAMLATAVVGTLPLFFGLFKDSGWMMDILRRYSRPQLRP